VVILYLETNFPMSIAMGRDPEAASLLSGIDPSVRLAIPGICFLEALGAIQHEHWLRRNFRDELERQITQIARDLVSPQTRPLLNHLDHARVEIDGLANEVKARFDQTLGQLGQSAEIIELTSQAIGEGLGEEIVDDPTDNLILSCIRGHARAHPSEAKAFLSGNTKHFGGERARAALREVGIDKYFTEARSLLGWLRSLPA
jgi:hypothetical protein